MGQERPFTDLRGTLPVRCVTYAGRGNNNNLNNNLGMWNIRADVHGLRCRPALSPSLMEGPSIQFVC